MTSKGIPKRAKPKRLVCIVEGKGEVEALPNLCSRVADSLKVSKTDWIVDPDPIRQPRSALVDESVAKPMRPPRDSTVRRAIELAISRPADAVLIVCDSDDDCAAVWGPQTNNVITKRSIRGGAVMIVREYEAWLLCSETASSKTDNIPIEQIRDAKTRLKKFVDGYKPTVHQLELTRKINIDSLRCHSDSFDKFVRTLASIFEVSCPSRKGTS